MSRRGTAAEASEAGLALVLVLWVLTLLSLIAAAFLTSTRGEMLATRARIDAARAEALADGAVHWAVERLLLQTFAADAQDPAAQLLPIDGRAVPLPMTGGRVQLQVQDTGGLIDLNAAQTPLIEGILVVVGVAPEAAAPLAHRILDYRDADGRARVDGAEDADYRALGLPFEAKDAPFDRVDELRQIPGMSLEVAERLAPFVTTLSGARGIDPAVAPAPVLAAVPGLAATQRELILEARREGGNADDLTDRGANPALVASSRASFRIIADATADNGGRFVREAVVQLRAGAGLVGIRRWEQGRPPDG